MTTIKNYDAGQIRSEVNFKLKAFLTSGLSYHSPHIRYELVQVRCDWLVLNLARLDLREIEDIINQIQKVRPRLRNGVNGLLIRNG
jgi:hypothetical protein